MSVKKVSVSLDADLSDNVREAAHRAGMSVSAWIGEAARERLRGESFDRWLEDWEREHGPLTPGELARAEEELRQRSARRAS